MNIGKAALSLLAGCATVALAVTAAPAAAYAQAASRDFSIPAQELDDALRAFALQSGVDVVFSADLVRGRRTAGLSGRHAPEEALRTLLAGSGLAFRRTGNGGYAVVPAPGEAEAGSAAAESGSAEGAGIAEILVVGNPSQNADIRRTEDDAQPYVVFDRRTIEASGASNLEDFFRTRLPMNTQATNFDQVGGTAPSPVSQINLRGLGLNQTLILVDGRRAPRVRDTVDFTQADINGIPLSAIERIEVLPSTASAIYGGGATGGVVNIIRRRDYRGLDARLGFDGTFHGGAETWRAELNGGLNFNHGDTRINFSGSYMRGEPLYAYQRDFYARGRALYLANGGLPTFAGSTPNIRSSTGASLVLDDGRPLNATVTYVPVGYAGPGSDGGTALLANAGQVNTDLSDDFRGRLQRLRAQKETWAFNLGARQTVTRWLDAFADLSFSQNEGVSLGATDRGQTSLSATAPGNPFRQAIVVYYPVTDFAQPAQSRSQSLSATGGMIANLGGGWSASAEYAWSRSRSRSHAIATALNASAYNSAIQAGTVNVFRDLREFPIDYSPYLIANPYTTGGPYDNVQQSATARFSGPLFGLPGGDVVLNGLLEHRIETASLASTNFPTARIVYPARSQSNDAGYLELRVPMVSERNRMPLVDTLDFQLSIRHDRYATRVATPESVALPPGDMSTPTFAHDTSRVRSTDYLIGGRWAPVRGLMFRASYATGFLPPSISQLVPFGDPATELFYADPSRGNSLIGGPVEYVSGGNPSLTPERSRALSVGLILQPSFLPGFQVHVDYLRIRKTDEIGFLSPEALLALEDSFPDRIVRGPRLPSDPPDWKGPIIFYDESMANIARSRVSAWDFRADYDFGIDGLGDFHVYGLATLQSEFRRQLLPTSAPFDTVDYNDGPLKWRGNVGLDWSAGDWTVSWNTQYYHSYSVRFGADIAGSQANVDLQGAERIPHQVYHDLYVRYRVSDTSSPLSGFTFSLGIQNVFDTQPPVFAQIQSYSPYGDPRLRRFSISINRHFGN